MDYRELLKKYMWHVLCEEGSTFVSRIRDYQDFSEEEVEALDEIDIEVDAKDRENTEKMKSLIDANTVAKVALQAIYGKIPK